MATRRWHKGYQDRKIVIQHVPNTFNRTVLLLITLMGAMCLLLVAFQYHHTLGQNYTIQVSQYLINTDIDTVQLNELNTLQLNNAIGSSKKSETMHMNRLKYVTFGSFIGIPNFYIKSGRHSHAHDDNLVTLCSVCSPNLLHQARSLSSTYKAGPLSIAIYIDEDISAHTIESQHSLGSLFSEYFANISTIYDVYIGLIYINTSSQFWIDLRYDKETEMAWKLPVNAMRNLAEYQVNTQWLFTVDIDFEFYSYGINNPVHRRTVLNIMQSIASDTLNKTIFIVPCFAINASYLVYNRQAYNDMTRSELLPLINRSIVPFYDGEPYQRCTDYQRWYNTQSDYHLVFNQLEYCQQCWAYEPFFIINANVSKMYQWDSDFTGRHKDKIQRMQYLRYHKFGAVVMRDLFMIHVNVPHVRLFFPTNGSRDFYPINDALLRKKRYFIKRSRC